MEKVCKNDERRKREKIKSIKADRRISKRHTWSDWSVNINWERKLCLDEILKIVK